MPRSGLTGQTRMLLGFFRLIGKIFFREIVIEGRENLPASGP